MTPTARCACVRYINVNQCHQAEAMVDYAGYKATPAVSRIGVNTTAYHPSERTAKTSILETEYPRACAMVQAFRLVAYFSDLNRDTMGRLRSHAPSHSIITRFRRFVNTFFATFFQIIFHKMLDFWYPVVYNVIKIKKRR